MVAGQSERLAVLQMVSEGKVSAEDGVRLLGALGSDSSAQPLPPLVEPESPEISGPTETAATLGIADAEAAGGKPRYFRVKVTDMRTGRAKVTVNMPFALVRWGLSVGAQFAPEVKDINLSELADILEQGYTGKLVDVMDEEDGEHVEVFVD
jgi:hypothetical protein